MKINPEKTVLMRITRKRLPLKFDYFLNGSSLSEVKKYKYLGVIFTSDLRWNEHISYIKKKAVSKFGYLRRTLRQAPQDIKLMTYKTFIRPIIEYASIVWDPYTKENIVHLESIQRKSVRFVYSTYSWRASASALAKKAELDSLQSRRHADRLQYLYLLYHNKIEIKKLFYPTCDQTNHMLSPLQKTARLSLSN